MAEEMSKKMRIKYMLFFMGVVVFFVYMVLTNTKP